MNKQVVKEVLNKYSGLSAGVKASLWFTICNILQRGISLLTTPIFTRLLTMEQYGVYTVYTSWYSIVSVIATLHLSASVYAKGLIKFEDDQNRFTSSMLGLYTFAVIVSFAIYLAFKNSFDVVFDLPPVCVYAMFAECLFYPAYTFWCTKQRIDYKYKAVIVFTLIMAVASPVIGIAAIKSTEHKAEARILSFVLIQVVMGLVMYIKLAMKGKTLYSKKYWIYALKFNLPLIPHYLSLIVLGQSDRIMISNLVSKSAASMYSVAYLVAQMLTLVTNAINYSYVPFAYRALKHGEHENLGKRIIQLLTFVSVALAGMMAIGPEIVKIVAASSYYEAVWIIPSVAAATYFQYMYNLFAVVEYHFDKTKFVMVVSVGSALVNIILNYIFIPMYGYQAAAYTTLFCYLITGILHYAFSTYVFKKQTGSVNYISTRKVFMVSVLPVAVMFVMLASYDYSILRYAFLAAAFIAVIIFRKRVFKIVRSIL